jgi:hypothetical protein
MAHDHEVSKTGKTEGKATGAPARGKAGSHLRSNVRSVLDLQNAAGNRAVARMLTAPASAISAGRAGRDSSATAPIAPVTVQRDELVDALKREMGGEEVNFRQLAQTLLRRSETLAKGPMTPVKENELAVKDKEAGTTATTTTAMKLRTAGLAGAGLLPMEELLKREKELRRPVTREEKAARDKQEELLEVEKRQDKADELRVRETTLRRKLTPAEIAARDKKDELDDLEKEQKDAEELRQFERKRKKPLNPNNLTMNQLLGGRKF